MTRARVRKSIVPSDVVEMQRDLPLDEPRLRMRTCTLCNCGSGSRLRLGMLAEFESGILIKDGVAIGRAGRPGYR